MEAFEKLKQLVAAAESDVIKSDSGNRAVDFRQVAAAMQEGRDITVSPRIFENSVQIGSYPLVFSEIFIDVVL